MTMISDKSAEAAEAGDEPQVMAVPWPDTETMPALFLGHGSPMYAIQENEFVAGFRQLALRLPRPKAILCVSAHWMTRGTFVTAMDKPRTIHDFGGFPPALYAVQYPAPGEPGLAELVREALQPTEVGLDYSWGLDHGAWSVLKHVYPDADIPVVQLSMDVRGPASYHYELGRRLRFLRNKGVLILGSGNIVHNLRLVDYQHVDQIGLGHDWAFEVLEKVNHYLLSRDHQAIIDFEKQGPAFRLAIPTPEHFLPLLYVLGAQSEDDRLELFNDKVVGAALSMTSAILQSAA